MDLDEIFVKCLKWDKKQCVKNTISMLMVGFQNPGIILWSRHSIGGLSCLGGGLRSLSALVCTETPIQICVNWGVKSGVFIILIRRGFNLIIGIIVPACNGLPNSACPYKASVSNVSFEYAELNLCKSCELTSRQINGALVPGNLIKDSLSFRNKFKNVSSESLAECFEYSVDGSTAVKQSQVWIMEQRQEVSHSLSLQIASTSI